MTDFETWDGRVNYAESEIEKHFNFSRKFKAEELESYRK